MAWLGVAGVAVALGLDGDTSGTSGLDTGGGAVSSMLGLTSVGGGATLVSVISGAASGICTRLPMLVVGAI